MKRTSGSRTHAIDRIGFKLVKQPCLEIDAAHLLKRPKRCGDFEVEEAEAGEPGTGEHL